MKRSQYQAVVIGGGVVGASVLYHLAKLGWNEVLLVERTELTAGSTWHAAADFHTLNADPNIAALQKYTIDLYQALETETGMSCGISMTGGINFAGTPQRWEWLQAQWAQFQTIGIDTARLVGVDEIVDLCPFIDPSGIEGGLLNTCEGHVDAAALTSTLVAAARARGADVVLHNPVHELRARPGGGWTVVTEHGTIEADHVVDAAGLWARRVGRMAGVDLPVVPLEHHYLVTEPFDEIATLARDIPTMVDLDGFSYLRREGRGVLLGLYELDPKHWQIDGAPWDFGTQLLTPDIDRIAPELQIGLSRYPCLDRVGIRRWVNGPFTFTPDGNPIVGPVPGRPGFWVACGVMAGFSQGGGVGLALAEWMVHGEPGSDVFGMDVARYGPFASADGYLKETTRQFYSRRFVMTFPNEQLPAGRPLRTSALYDEWVSAGARFMVSWGLEMPNYFVDDPDFVEQPTLRRSNAFEHVRREVACARETVGLLDITSFARYAVRGPDARSWLDRLLACRIPAPGGIRLAPMLSDSGRLLGDLTVTCWADDEFWLIGSYYLRAWHGRYFASQLGEAKVTVEDLTDNVAGISVCGPNSRELLARVTEADLSGLRLMRAATLDVGRVRARVGRLSVTGELGYELSVPAGELRALYRSLREAGAGLGAAPIGFGALGAARLEKSYGIWSKEFTWAYTPGMNALADFVAFDKPGFIGRDAALRERDAGPTQRLVTLTVDPDGEPTADASTFDPVWQGERRVGFVTSGGYEPTVGASLALAYVHPDCAGVGTELDVHVVGVRTPARVIADSPHDPTGARMRS